MKVVAVVYPEGFSYQYRHPNPSIQKRKYTFIYSGIFYHKLCFFLLHLNKVYFQEENIPFPWQTILKHKKGVAWKGLIQ